MPALVDIHYQVYAYTGREPNEHENDCKHLQRTSTIIIGVVFEISYQFL